MDKGYRTALTPGETQEPLKDFLNTFLLTHQYNSPSSPHTQGASGLAKSSLSSLIRWHIVHSLNHCYSWIYDAVMGEGVCVFVCVALDQVGERKMREVGEKAFWHFRSWFGHNDGECKQLVCFCQPEVLSEYWTVFASVLTKIKRRYWAATKLKASTELYVKKLMQN